ncbi:lipoic acid synthetase [Methylohalomonas lacus]|uniref:Lipoyl synthase n=1 Tax=Methylohalomonas lacus TaxID=398773 RepID=A0AAE3L1G4_9GAMM|nr:lipoyl synthase [Methylohalomonas lacus]MCS3903146.1 lipoic acid synthetase [Methylohalomonas lacus]
MTEAQSPSDSKPRASRGEAKTRPLKIPVRVEGAPMPRKPHWIRAQAPTDPKVLALKKLIREKQLHTVCEEAACPNLGECFAHGTATFMIMGELCTRRCPFCDVAHGRPDPLDPNEPEHLADAIEQMGLNYVVITSVDRDDLKDGGAAHFVDCVRAIRRRLPEVRIEVLTPDFRKREAIAIDAFTEMAPDVFNHNLETVPRLYRYARPGAVYEGSLRLLKQVRARLPQMPTKSGLMLGLGETIDEVKQVLADLRAHDVDMLTLGQYLQPSQYHLPVARFVTPAEFDELGDYARGLGFSNVASGPMVRSSYHADRQAAGESF